MVGTQSYMVKFKCGEGEKVSTNENCIIINHYSINLYMSGFFFTGVLHNILCQKDQ